MRKKGEISNQQKRKNKESADTSFAREKRESSKTIVATTVNLRLKGMACGATTYCYYYYYYYDYTTSLLLFTTTLAPPPFLIARSTFSMAQLDECMMCTLRIKGDSTLNALEERLRFKQKVVYMFAGV